MGSRETRLQKSFRLGKTMSLLRLRPGKLRSMLRHQQSLQLNLNLLPLPNRSRNQTLNRSPLIMILMTFWTFSIRQFQNRWLLRHELMPKTRLRRHLHLQLWQAKRFQHR